jgi:hypothetical protein
MPLLGRPAYRLGGQFGRSATVFADTGELFAGADPSQALAAVVAFAGAPPGSVRFVETVGEIDQWTMTEASHLPLERFDVDDGHGTRVYFSRASGEVELVTNRANRTLAWIGTIPHWFYYTSLRANGPLWSRIVIGLSIAGCVMALLGIVLAITQFRRSKPFRLSASVRYRGWMRWHYYTGALFGVFALTWVFSGLMSMEPFAWNNAVGMSLPPNDLEGGPLDLDRYRLGNPEVAAVIGPDVAEIDLMRIQAEPYIAVVSADAGGVNDRRLIHAISLDERTDVFPADGIISELEATVTAAAIREHDVLEAYDAYYYARDDALPLPVLRVKFDDPAATHLGSNHRLSRLERWLFNGLHSLDFSFWYGRRPLWDIGLIVLSLGALATSSIGMYLGLRRLAGRADTRPAGAGRDPKTT